MLPFSPVRRAAHFCSALTLTAAIAGCQAPATVTPPMASPSAPAAAAPAAPTEAPASAAPAAPVAGNLQSVVTGADGPIAGAQVTVYAMKNLGGTPLATGTTGADGTVSLLVADSAAGQPLAVIAQSGGATYASITAIDAAAPAARRVLAVNAPVSLTFGSTLAFLALRDRVISVALLSPPWSVVQRVLASFNKAATAGLSSQNGTESADKALHTLDATGQGTISPQDASTLVTKDSPVAKEFASAASDLGVAIAERLKASGSKPGASDNANFSFGNAFDTSVASRVKPHRGSGGGSSAPAPETRHTYVLQGSAMSVNETDGSVWVLETDGATLHHRDSANQVVGSATVAWGTPSALRSVSDGSVWAFWGGPTGHLAHYANDGAVLSTVDHDLNTFGGGLGMSVDRGTGRLWVLGSEGQFYTMGPEASAPLTQLTGLYVNRMAANPSDHTAWAFGAWSTAPMTSVLKKVTSADVTTEFGSAAGSIPELLSVLPVSGNVLRFSSKGTVVSMYDNAGAPVSQLAGVDLQGAVTDNALSGSTIQVDASDDGVWMFKSNQPAVAHFGATFHLGTLSGVTSLSNLRADASDHTAWLIDSNGSTRRLLHLDANAAIIEADTATIEMSSGDVISDLGIGLNTAWVLTEGGE